MHLGRGTEAPPPTYSARILPTPGRADLTDAAVARLAACPRGAEVRVGREGDGDWSSTSSWRAAGTAGRPTTDAVLLLGTHPERVIDKHLLVGRHLHLVLVVVVVAGEETLGAKGHGSLGLLRLRLCLLGLRVGCKRVNR